MFFYISITSGIILVTLFLLFKTEQAKGRMVILVTLRDRLDRKIISYNHKRAQNRHLRLSSIKLFLHFIVHKAISLMLNITTKIQLKLKRLRHRNKVLAKTTKDTTENKNHLQHIADYKESVSLSEEEEAELKERSLND